jgi:hypothetical protein
MLLSSGADSDSGSVSPMEATDNTDNTEET